MHSTASSILQEKLSTLFGSDLDFRLQPVAGGSINDSYRLQLPGHTFFCKINSASKFPHLFQKEKLGLALLAAKQLIKTPAVIDCFEEDDFQFLLLEWIAQGERTAQFWKMFGEQLAALHQLSASWFGLNEDNYMGSVPQRNNKHQSWCSFFAAERLTPMVERCRRTGLLSSRHCVQFSALEKSLPGIFEEEAPSLLHGDLWSGNFMCSASGEPVLIDPAVYYGHRSIDLAMTTLFGGFRPPFYEAYHYHFPLPKNHKEQWAVCNLYPLLIHLYLFGPGFLPPIEATLKQFT